MRPIDIGILIVVAILLLLALRSAIRHTRERAADAADAPVEAAVPAAAMGMLVRAAKIFPRKRLQRVPRPRSCGSRVCTVQTARNPLKKP